jgi:hypothetical protein
MIANLRSFVRVKLYRNWFPIVLVEAYLIFTLLLFAFGPVEYFVEDQLLFWGCIFVYHLSFISGYSFGISQRSFVIRIKSKPLVSVGMLYWILVISAIVAFFIGHKNITMSDSLLPDEILKNLLLGLENNQEVYANKISRVAEYSGDKILNMVYLLFGYSRIILVSFLVYKWGCFGFFKKSLILFVSVLPVVSGISVGTNKPFFDFAFIFGISLALYFIGNYFKEGKFKLRSRMFFILISVFSLFGAIVYFGFAMQSRGGSADYIVGTSPLGHIRLNDSYLPVDDLSIVASTWVWLSSYLVQGYYGFSQALLVDFSWTYGVGNSQFLSRQVEWMVGVNPLDGSFPHKISPVWDENAQWHSWYSHLASDLHFLGVAIFLALFGYYFARVWRSFCNSTNIYSAYLLPLFGVAFIFTPANNQVFGFIETLSAFLFLSILWLGVRLFWVPPSEVSARSVTTH